MFFLFLQVTDINLVRRALDELEVFPMSLDQLQETRAGMILQSIRHNVDSSMKRRIRDIIRAWQQLLDPSTPGIVIPLQRRIKTSKSATGIISSSSSATNPLSTNTSTNSPIPTNGLTHKSLPPRTLSASKAPPVIRRPNGSSPNPFNGHVAPPTLAEGPKLAKVKSTAELIAAAGGCIDSVTKDRILSNRIAKESDEFPRFVPQTTARAPRRPKQQDNLFKSRVSAAAVASPKSQSVLHREQQPVISAAKSEMIAKYLEHSAAEMATPQEPTDQVDQVVSPTPTITHSADNASKSKHHRHHKEKKKHKRKLSGEVGDKSHEAYKKVPAIPVTNCMDKWPQLPPLTGEALALAARQDEVYHSGESPTQEELRDLGRVDALIAGSWPEVSASRDGTNQLQPMTSLYSVDMGDDQVMHILPWANLSGSQKSFFPPTAELDIDRLIGLPEPW